MRRTVSPSANCRQRGNAAVEFAIILPVLVILISVPLFFGRCLWHYTVVQKAAHDAARYMATVPAGEIKNPVRAMDAAAVARYIATEETAELQPGGQYPVSIDIFCDDLSCNLGQPLEVRAVVRVKMFDPIFGQFTSPFIGEDGILMKADVSMRYVGP
jgi:hypothetical protein